ncbi:MAG: SGNH/GDSL hydrolase family protein [Erysipelotrichaceae bacterium]|nr:SGNH/GDSL hydrolase family protein [Erysipelotrichaceae bacterium]
MKKEKYISCFAFIALIISSCSNNITDSLSSDLSSIDESNSKETSSIEESISVNESSNNLSQSNNSEDDILKIDSIIPYDEIEIAVNEQYNLASLYEDQSAIFEIVSDDLSIVAPDEFDCINGLKEGSCNVRFYVYNVGYDDVLIHVKDKEYMQKNIKLNAGNLTNKTFTVFGDSISDVKVTAYNDNRPTFWCEQLVDRFDMTMYNEAISGSTTGYCNARPEIFSICGTYVVNLANVKKELAMSDYAFIYFGNNDATYNSTIGEIGDITDNNFHELESVKGAYSYIIDKIRMANENITIICLSMSYSTWSAQEGRIKTNQAIKEVVEEKNCKYIDIFTLWNASNYTTYCPDGIHPQTAGYNLIVDAILSS